MQSENLTTDHEVFYLSYINKHFDSSKLKLPPGLPFKRATANRGHNWYKSTKQMPCSTFKYRLYGSAT